LPARWIVRDEIPDYLVDCSVEIVNDSGRLSGRRFFVQLKATDGKTKNEQVGVRIAKSAIPYWKTLNGPVLLAAYHSPSRSMRFAWAHSLDPYFAVSRGKDWEFRLPEQSEVDLASSLEESVRHWYALHGGEKRGKLRLRLLTTQRTFRGQSIPRVIEALLGLLEGTPSGLEIGEIGGETVDGEVHIAEDAIRVQLFGAPGVWIHENATKSRRNALQESRSRRSKRAVLPGAATETAVAGDILAATAIALMNAGLGEVAAEVAVTALRHATVTSNEAAFSSLLDIALRAGAVEQCFNAALSIALTGKLEESQLIAFAAMLTPSSRFTENQVARSLLAWHEAIDALLPERIRGIQAYNVGRYLTRVQEFRRDGVRLMLKARTLDSAYACRPYFWTELAGAFFETRRYICSERAYACALRLGAPNNVHALRADALLHCSKVDMAHRALELYSGDDPQWLARRVALEVILRFQQQVSAEMQALVGDSASDDAIVDSQAQYALARHQAEAMLARNPISGRDWFNRGVASANLQQHSVACESFLVAASLERSDIEAWVNAAVSGYNWSLGIENAHTDGLSYAALAMMVSTSIERERSYQRFVALLPPDAEVAREELRKLVSTFPRKAPEERIVRLVSGDSYEEIPLETEVSSSSAPVRRSASRRKK